MHDVRSPAPEPPITTKLPRLPEGALRHEHSTAAHAVVELAREARRAGEDTPSPPNGVTFANPAEFPTSVRIAKRTVDIVGSTVAILLTAPVMAVIAALVKLTSKGPVFYHQERVLRVVGRDEITFKMHKFRTMVADAEARTGPVWAGQSDPRITSVGRFLRRSRLDELPQFWNVLKGEMSIVGPRPERPHFTAQLQDQIPVYYDRVAELKPGITGWAQVRCPYDTSLDSVKMKLLYDLAYAAHCYRLGSYLRMELKVMLLTVVVIFTGKGAQ
ncbi:MAG: sugar transferase [Myxococcales bacterium]|nr:sugar transferase [Myxococcales bacterium]MCB9531310.1 sugar transferase [Myxococcales bacterium]